MRRISAPTILAAAVLAVAPGTAAASTRHHRHHHHHHHVRRHHHRARHHSRVQSARVHAQLLQQLTTFEQQASGTPGVAPERLTATAPWLTPSAI